MTTPNDLDELTNAAAAAVVFLRAQVTCPDHHGQCQRDERTVDYGDLEHPSRRHCPWRDEWKETVDNLTIVLGTEDMTEYLT